MTDKNLGNILGGSVTFWSLSDAQRSALEAAWPKDDPRLSALCPKPPTPAQALKGALEEVYGENKGGAKANEERVLVRPLAKEGHYAVVRETPHNSNIDYATCCTAFVEGEDPVVCGVGWGEESRVRSAFKARAETVPALAIGRALIKAAEALQGVSLRERGGVYWIPGADAGAWQRVAEAVERACNEGRGEKEPHAAVYRIDAQISHDTARAVLDAVKAEAREAAAQIEADVAQGDLGKRAAETRQQRARELLGKVRRYEGDFGEALDDVRAALEHAETVASLAALADQEEGPSLFHRPLRAHGIAPLA